MNVAHSNQKGAVGLEMEGGGKEMIDAPMLKQVGSIRLSGLAVEAHGGCGTGRERDTACTRCWL